MKEQNERERLIPEIERYEKMIEDMKKSILNNEAAVEKEQARTEELNEKNQVLENKKDELREELDGLTATYLKIKDEPNRMGKTNDNLKIAVDHLRAELESINREIANTETHTAQEKAV